MSGADTSTTNSKDLCIETSLLIEGGGMRGFYSAGILKCLYEAGFRFPYVIGVSSGSLNAAAYLAGHLDVDFASMSRSSASFFSALGLIRPRRGLVHTDEFIDTIAPDCQPGVCASPSRLLVPAVDVETAQYVWWERSDFAAGAAALRERLIASCSIPFVMPQARVDGRVYVDGGIIDSIPIKRAEADGYRRHVVILNRPRGYVKSPQHLELYMRAWLRPYPALKQLMLTRHIRYNEGARHIEALEDEGNAFVFRMEEPNLGRFEWSPAKFEQAFEDGYRYATGRLGELRTFLGSAPVSS